MDFLGIVQDQIVNIAPMGVEEGGPSPIYPRLEGWLAACDLYDIPRSSRPSIVDLARALFDGVHGRITVHGLHMIPIDELEDPVEDDLDGRR